MPKMHISKSIEIQKSASEVYPLLADYHHWSNWSPWLILEKGVTVNVNEDGKYYEWDGKLVGAGNMTVLEEDGGSRVKSDLTFLKPWKSKAIINMYVKAKGEGCEVTWTMDSSLPFFMFWMKKMMEFWVGMDFERGLKMLKDLAEYGKVRSELEFKGMEQFAGTKYVGIRVQCGMHEMGAKMQQNYEMLMPYFKEHHADSTEMKPFTIYHKWEPMKNRVEYTAAIPVNEVPGTLPAGTVSGNVPACAVHVVRHNGPFDHVGNAWSAQMMRQRSKTFKVNKHVHPMEVYFNSPKDTAPENLVSEVWMAVKN
jgi:predicted transcriptional regulator YdeE